MEKTWICHARPASLDGRACGQTNTSGKYIYTVWIFGERKELECCIGCGCTRYASNDRLKQNEEIFQD